MNMNASHIGGPFGALCGGDPLRFALHSGKHFRSTIKALTQRWSDRTGVSEWEVDSEGGPVSFPLAGRGEDDAATLALKLSLCALRDESVLIDEAGRMALGQAPGARGLEGASVLFDLPPMYGVGRDEAGEEGMLTIPAYLTAGVPLAVSSAASILPALFDLAADRRPVRIEAPRGLEKKSEVIPGVPNEIAIFAAAMAFVILS